MWFLERRKKVLKSRMVKLLSEVPERDGKRVRAPGVLVK